MSDMQIPDIPGAEVVSSWFGRWPSFHDAEILHLHLNRAGTSRLSIHAWSMSAQPSEVDAQGHLRTDKHAVVTFELKDISDLELFDFSRQNVLASLEVARDGKAVHILLHPSYGLGGRIDAGQVVVSLTPGKPTVG
jgi:immunity protein 50 of polymorphic toxin system